jgi:hypothetical protein
MLVTTIVKVLGLESIHVNGMNRSLRKNPCALRDIQPPFSLSLSNGVESDNDFDFDFDFDSDFDRKFMVYFEFVKVLYARTIGIMVLFLECYMFFS